MKKILKYIFAPIVTILLLPMLCLWILFDLTIYSDKNGFMSLELLEDIWL